MKHINVIRKGAYAAVILLSFSIMACLIEVTFANPLPAPPILTIYIRSDGSIDPSNVPIQRTGNVYTFTGDIKNATIEIQRNNIILNGAGYTLRGNDQFWNIAINLTDTNYTVIKNLNITNYACSLSLTNSTNITVLNNTILSESGIICETSEKTQIIGNTITGQDKGFGHGIRLLNSSNNLIVANNFKDTGSAIRIGLTSKNNTFYHNNFLNNKNSVGAYIEDDNFEKWSNTDKEGNYWSNFNGTDENFDGVGDTPYVIDEKRQDPYPLMVPYNITNFDVDIQMPTVEQDQNHTTIITAAATLTVAITIGAILIIYFKKQNHNK